MAKLFEFGKSKELNKDDLKKFLSRQKNLKNQEFSNSWMNNIIVADNKLLRTNQKVIYWIDLPKGLADGSFYIEQKDIKALSKTGDVSPFLKRFEDNDNYNADTIKGYIKRIIEYINLPFENEWETVYPAHPKKAEEIIQINDETYYIFDENFVTKGEKLLKNVNPISSFFSSKELYNFLDNLLNGKEITTWNYDNFFKIDYEKHHLLGVFRTGSIEKKFWETLSFFYEEIKEIRPDLEK